MIRWGINGLKLGQYQLLEKIDLGGMAEIYRARRIGPHGFEKIVAIKVILPHLSRDKEFLAMFSSEARVAAQLQHPNIVQIYDYDQENDTYYIAMEYIHGLNLNDLVSALQETGRQFPLSQINYILKNICAALDYAHSRTDLRGRPLEIVHRDINPKNVMVSFSGEIKLMDFGIALATTRCFQTLAEGMIRGKIAYLSPEQVKSEELDRRSDLFSMGIVFYELVTGERPFASDTEFGILRKIEKAEYVPPIEIIPTLPPEIDAIIARCLARNREDRYQTAGDIRQSIEQFERRSGLRTSQQEFVKFLELVLGSELVRSPMIIDDTGPPHETRKRSDPPVPAKAETSVDSQTTGPDPVDTLSGIDTITPVSNTGLASDLDTEYRGSRFLEALRFPMIVLFILLIAAGSTYFILGKDGFLRLIGIAPGIFETQISIRIEPEEAAIELDFIPIDSSPSVQDIAWQYGSSHNLSISHPACQPVNLILTVPMTDTGPMMLESPPPEATLTVSRDGYVLSVQMVPEYLSVRIRSNPSGARVFIDSIDTGKHTPTEFSFQTGAESVVELHQDGYAPTRQTFTADPHLKTNLIELSLEKLPSPTSIPVPKGRIRVNSPYPVDVYSRNRVLSRGIQDKTFTLTEGTHKFRILNEEFLLDSEHTVTVKQNKIHQISIEPTGTMIVNADQPGCRVYIQDKEIGTAPGRFELAPGLYNVTFKWDDCPGSVSRWVKIISGQNRSVPKLQGCR
ncbi:serine/threonine protein kinase [bacterium]|nr:serine/threonine protein kinase [candidate division CSSED10-310 bacterium]